MSLEFDDIYRELSLPQQESENEEELLKHIMDRVEYFLHHDKGLLLSYMYRLDIDERIIEKAILEQEDDPIAYTLAKLILDRQKKRVETKKKYGQPPPIEGWEY
ncbi:MAG: hypothetical protein IPL63_15530 [Saprospiraceae bacterium]|nr:hypothetical protein [Saprospiraceae bacterium]MBK6564930.1 hypothetical protein [Saprospiraceae bacterium]MBK6783076.1 hypothetical protein [Saprospiraceae bacterium]MBK7523571.1 hypothetical protein [Saprospiraceae bacterium]MBK8371440.1 hypothetical protein [Saprospiraceae bacterium]